MAALKHSLNLIIVAAILAAFLSVFAVNSGSMDASTFSVGCSLGDYGNPGLGSPITIIDQNNPADRDGKISRIQIYVEDDLYGVEIGSFYSVNESLNYSCRDHTLLGNISAGYSDLYGIEITVNSGDYLGIYYTDGNMSVSTTGGGGIATYAGDGTSGTVVYSNTSNYCLAIAGSGEAPYGGTYYEMVFPCYGYPNMSDVDHVSTSTIFNTAAGDYEFDGPERAAGVAAARNAISGTVMGIGMYGLTWIAAGLFASPSEIYVYRTYLQFDTSSIPDGEKIVGGYITLGYENWQTITPVVYTSYLLVIDGSPMHDILLPGDYNQALYNNSAIGGIADLSDFGDGGYFDSNVSVSLNDVGCTFIDPSGRTKILIRTERDVDWTGHFPYDSGNYILSYTGGYGYYPPPMSITTLHVYLESITEPSGLVAASNSSSSMFVTWIKPPTVTGVIVRCSTDGYPSDRNSGTLVYMGANASVTQTGLPSGTKYYYRAWSYYTEDGETSYSTLYDDTYATTLYPGTYSGGNESIIVIDMPMEDWYGNSSCAGNIPMRAEFLKAAQKIGCSPCVLIIGVVAALSTGISVSIFLFSGSLVFAFLAGLVVLVGGYWVGALPVWILMIYFLLGISLYFVLRRA